METDNSLTLLPPLASDVLLNGLLNDAFCLYFVFAHYRAWRA